MKKTLIIVLALTLFSCKKESQEPFGAATSTTATASTTATPEALGKEVFEGKGACVSCHRIDTKLIGPSLQEIAKIYKEKQGNIVAFLREEDQPIIDPSQYDVMKTNLVITKGMSEEELKGLEAYIYSHSK